MAHEVYAQSQNAIHIQRYVFHPHKYIHLGEWYLHQPHFDNSENRWE
jgi:hypothetical protein